MKKPKNDPTSPKESKNRKPSPNSSVKKSTACDRQTRKKRSNRRLTSEDWFKRLSRKLKKYSASDRSKVLSYIPSIREGIRLAANYRNIDIEKEFQDSAEAYEYELLRKNADYILKNAPSKTGVRGWAFKLAFKRMSSWFMSGVRYREAYATMEKPFIHQCNNEGVIEESGFNNHKALPALEQSNPARFDPETCVIHQQLNFLVMDLPATAGKSKKERSKEYQRIFEIQLSGVNVVRKHANLIGCKPEEVAGLKYQAFEFAKTYFSKKVLGLKEAHAIYKKQKGKSWKAERSTFEERCDLNRSPYQEEMEPQIIRSWKVLNGEQAYKPKAHDAHVQNVCKEPEDEAA